jgi:hypothetical protein
VQKLERWIDDVVDEIVDNFCVTEVTPNRWTFNQVSPWESFSLSVDAATSSI